MKNKKLRITIISILSLLILLCGAFYIYTLDYNRTNTEVYDMDGYKYSIIKDNMTIFLPTDNVEQTNNTGIIFYPGGKVEASAYSPLLIKLAESGISCILIDMPMNLAIFDINAADDVYGHFPEIDQWYLMGHSLGGAIASKYVEDNYTKLKGLIILGAYPLNDADVDTIIIYGSEDVGLNRDKLEGIDNQFEIAGGNHSYFGNYGENRSSQKRDGVTTITKEEQQNKTVELILDFIAGD